jgi:hypothetical protein
MVVEANFANGHYFGVLRQSANLAGVALLEMLRVMRVNSNRAENPIVLLGQQDGRFQVVRSRAASGGHEIAKTGRAASFEHRFAIRVEVRIIKMCVRINEHGYQKGKHRRQPASFAMQVSHLLTSPV